MRGRVFWKHTYQVKKYDTVYQVYYRYSIIIRTRLPYRYSLSGKGECNDCNVNSDKPLRFWDCQIALICSLFGGIFDDMSHPPHLEMISTESAALAAKKSDSRLGASTCSPVQQQEDILSTKTALSKKKRKPMLTSSQLSDLFTRLDKNGDGELDLDEFTGIIKMLRIQVTPDYVARVFRSVDQSTGLSEVSGTLDMQEFIAAYQKIYCGANVDDVGTTTKKKDNFIRATRYGCQTDGQFIFECYTIPSHGAAEKFTIPNLPRDGSILGNSEVTKHDGDHLHKLKTANKEIWTGTVDDIIIMIRDDSIKNKAHHGSVFWWIDLAYSSVDRTTAEEIATKFGLPNNSKFLSSFGNFGSGMPGDVKSRMFAGIGNHTSGNVYSLSYFIQSMWIKGVPVVHHLPPFLRSLQCFTCNSNKYLGSLSDMLVQYYTSRFAWMVNFSWLGRSTRDEQLGAYERAEGLAVVSSSDGSSSCCCGSSGEYSNSSIRVYIMNVILMSYDIILHHIVVKEERRGRRRRGRRPRPL